MKTVTLMLFAALMLAQTIATACAADAERVAVLELMSRVFAAVNSRKPNDWRALQLAEGTNLSVRQAPDGEPGELRMQLVTNEEFVADMSSDGQIYRERWTGTPTVLIRGPIAVVWGEYDFWIDGVFSHCGVNTADVVKVDGEWKLANIMWTAERANCPTAP